MTGMLTHAAGELVTCAYSEVSDSFKCSCCQKTIVFAPSLKAQSISQVIRDHLERCSHSEFDTDSKPFPPSASLRPSPPVGTYMPPLPRRTWSAEDERRRRLEEDPDAYDVGPHSVTCAGCHRPIRLNATGRYYAANWNKHKMGCKNTNAASGAGAISVESKFTGRVAAFRVTKPTESEEPVPGPPTPFDHGHPAFHRGPSHTYEPTCGPERSQYVQGDRGDIARPISGQVFISRPTLEGQRRAYLETSPHGSNSALPPASIQSGHYSMPRYQDLGERGSRVPAYGSEQRYASSANEGGIRRASPRPSVRGGYLPEESSPPSRYRGSDLESIPRLHETYPRAYNEPHRPLLPSERDHRDASRHAGHSPPASLARLRVLDERRDEYERRSPSYNYNPRSSYSDEEFAPVGGTLLPRSSAAPARHNFSRTLPPLSSLTLSRSSSGSTSRVSFDRCTTPTTRYYPDAYRRELEPNESIVLPPIRPATKAWAESPSGTKRRLPDDESDDDISMGDTYTPSPPRSTRSAGNESGAAQASSALTTDLSSASDQRVSKVARATLSSARSPSPLNGTAQRYESYHSEHERPESDDDSRTARLHPVWKWDSSHEGDVQSWRSSPGSED